MKTKIEIAFLLLALSLAPGCGTLEKATGWALQEEVTSQNINGQEILSTGSTTPLRSRALLVALLRIGHRELARLREERGVWDRAVFFLTSLNTGAAGNRGQHRAYVSTLMKSNCEILPSPSTSASRSISIALVPACSSPSGASLGASLTDQLLPRGPAGR